MDKFFVVTTPGLKAITAQEMMRLGLLPSSKEGNEAGSSPGSGGAGGIEIEGRLEDLYRLNLYLRTATRVLVRLGEFYAAAFSELRKKASRLPWENYLAPGAPVALRVTSHKSRLYHSSGVAERVAGAIRDRLGQDAPIQPFDENAAGEPAQLIVVRLARDLCTISVDSSGEGLHRRGYRLATAKAPLRETLAAGMLLASGWDLVSPLVDPFCGSGTIPIEAAMMKRGLAPGCKRRFAFMQWPGFRSQVWQNLLQEAEASAVDCPPGISASDRDAGAVEMAQANAGRARVGGCIAFSQRALSAIEPEGVGWVVTNPPYGLRVRGGKDLRNLYAQLGNVLRSLRPGWRVAILSSQDYLLSSTGLRFEKKISTVNGGVGVKLALGRVD